MMKKDRKSFNQSLAEWKLFIYNLTTGEFLRHTAQSRGLVLLLSLVFHGFLAALLTFAMWVRLQTLNDEVPNDQDQISSPGLSVVPKPETALEYALSVSEPESCKGYTEDLNTFLKPYASEAQKNLRNFSLNRRAQFMKQVGFLLTYLKHAAGRMILTSATPEDTLVFLCK